jgi:tetratricopeptide (TPR) repeat protein
MVTAQNVQIQAENTVSTSPTAAPPKMVASAAVPLPVSSRKGSNTKQPTSSTRPNNKRSSIDNAFFNAIARRRISTSLNDTSHSQSMKVAHDVVMTATEDYVPSSPSCTSSHFTTSPDNLAEEWLFHPMPFHPHDTVLSTIPIEPSAIAFHHNTVLKSIQSIIESNDTAADRYRIGEYDGALEALREGQSLRESLESIVNPIQSDVTSYFASSFSRCESMDTKVEDKTVARSSYIYQRMDFDEGMHSYADMEKIDGNRVLEFEEVNGQTSMEVRHAVIQSTLLFNEGQVHRRRGEFDVAATKYENALGMLTSVDFDQYELLISILHNIGQLQYRRGELSSAMKTYDLALTHAKSMPDGTVHVAAALNCLGVLHYHANSSDNEDDKEDLSAMEDSSTDKAMELFQQALALRRQCLGPDHVDVATTLNNIGRIHVQGDQFDQALGYYQDALRIRRISLGTNSLDYAATAFNAGQSLHQKGKLNEAIELYHEFLRVATMKFGKSHRDVAVVLSGIAQIHQEQKNFDKALELYEESLTAGRDALGENHSEIAMLLNRMGNFHFERERLADALKCYRRGLRIEKEVLPPDHPNIIVTYSNLGEIYRQRSEWDEAAKMYSEALQILKNKHDGADNSEVATTLNTIGLINDQRGDSYTSLRYLQDALAMRRRIVAAGGNDQSNLDVAATLVYIGTILYRRTQFHAAIELFTESLQLRQQFLGKDHRDTAFVMYNIALVHQQRGDYEKSIEFYTETLRIEKVVLGENHKDVCMTLFKLGEVNKHAGKTVEALQCFQESLEIERSLSNNPSRVVGTRPHSSSPDPAAMARTLTEIGNIHLANGDVVPMMDAFNEASRLYRSAGLSPHNIVVSGQHAYAIDFSFPEAAPAA